MKPVYVLQRKSLIALFLICVSFAKDAYAQSNIQIPSFTRSVSGTVFLEGGPAKKDYTVTAKVTRWRFDITNTYPVPTFRYVREESYLRNVVIRKGRSSTNYAIGGISTLGLRKLSLSFTCSDCGPIMPLQYLSPTGNEYSYDDSVLYSNDDLPNRVNFTLNKGNTIKGEIRLSKEEQVAPRDLELFVLGVNQSSFPIFRTNKIVLEKGKNSVKFETGGFRPDLRSTYSLLLLCENCEGIAKRTTRLNRDLQFGEDYNDIDFRLMNPGQLITPIISILLED